MQTRATHPKTARREAKSDKKKEERIGAQLMAEITEPIDDTATAAAVSDPAWKPSSSHLQPTWALQPERKCGGHGGGNHACAPAVDLAALSQLTAWVEQRHALDDVQFHATGAGTRTPLAAMATARRVRAVFRTYLSRWPSTLQLLIAAASSMRSTAFKAARRGDRPLHPQLRTLSVRLYTRCRMICRACRCYWSGLTNCLVRERLPKQSGLACGVASAILGDPNLRARG